MILRLCLLNALLWAASLAHGGAWPRGEGGVFASLSQDFTRRDDGTIGTYLSFHGEYGLTDRLTFGLKGGRDNAGTASDATLFARLPVLQGDGPNRFAVQFGVGLRQTVHGSAEPLIEPGVAWGRGLDSRWGAGWLGVEASTTLGLTTGHTHGKLDLTFGLSPGPKSHVIVQLQTYHDRNGSLFKLAPSYVRRIGGTMKIEIGLIQPLNGGRGTGLKAGTWFEW